MGWKEGGCEDWLFFFLHTSVCSECSSDHDADGWGVFLFFFCFFGDLISEGTFCHILEFQTFLEVLQSC